MKSLLALAICWAAAQDADYIFPLPEGWRSERIPLPPDFAKDLDYKGHEDLRFAPGMFKAEAPDYFSYAIVMWLEGTVSFEPASLEKDLLKYYKGLCASVAKGKKLDLDLSKITVKLTKQEKKGTLGGAEAVQLRGRIDWYDPFVTGKPLTLELEIWARSAALGRRTCLFILASPKEKTTPVWEALRKIQSDFACPK